MYSDVFCIGVTIEGAAWPAFTCEITSREVRLLPDGTEEGVFCTAERGAAFTSETGGTEASFFPTGVSLSSEARASFTA